MSQSAKFRRRTLVVLTVAVVGGATTIAVGQTGSYQAPTGPQIQGAKVNPPTGDFSSDTVRRFSSLRKAVPSGPTAGPRSSALTQDDAMLADPSGLGGRFGLNPSKALRVRSTPGSTDVVVIPGIASLCVSGEKVGISCMEQVDAGHGFDAATCGSIPDGVVAVYGLVPDAAQDVRLSLANGTTLAGDVEGSYLYAEVPVTSPDELPTSVSWATADGDESYRVPASVPQTCARD